MKKFNYSSKPSQSKPFAILGPYEVSFNISYSSINSTLS